MTKENTQTCDHNFSGRITFMIALNTVTNGLHGDKPGHAAREQLERFFRGVFVSRGVLGHAVLDLWAVVAD